jgi:subtilisin
MNNGTISRRDVLRSVGASAGVGGLATTGGATDEEDDSETFVVGIESTTGLSSLGVQSTRVRRELDFGDLGGAVTAEFSPAEAKQLADSPGVRYVDREVELRATGQDLPWGIDRVDANEAHEGGKEGSGADIAILDTGIDSDHPDLAPNLGTGYAVEPCQMGDCQEPWDDDNNHGTHVAGIADARSNSRGVVGVSTKATLHGVKVLTGQGSGSASGVAEGIKWVADQGYDVLNMSLGAPSGNQVLRDAVKYADERGVLVVSSAGNAGPCFDCVGYPAAYPEVIAVSSTTENDTLSEFSSTGPQVELAAPGSDILSTVVGGYNRYSGTSMSSPHVAGAAGQLLAEGLSKTEARQRLSETAEDIGLDENESGAGLVDVLAALDGGGGGGGGGDELGVETRSPTEVSDESATLRGSLLGLGDAETVTVSLSYWRADDRDGSESTVGERQRSTAGAFETTVDGLDAATEYVTVATVQTADGTTVTGDQISFTTDAPRVDPVVETMSPEWVSRYDAHLRGELVSLGDTDAVEPGFAYWIEGRRSETETVITDWEMDEPGTFERWTDSLEAGETYLAAAFVRLPDDRVITAEPVQFVPGEWDGNPAAIEVETDYVWDVTDDEATLSGYVTDTGGVPEVETGFTYWIEGRRAETAETAFTGDVSDTDEFEDRVVRLQPETTYVFQAEAWPEGNRDTLATGQTGSFTTGPDAD